PSGGAGRGRKYEGASRAAGHARTPLIEQVWAWRRGRGVGAVTVVIVVDSGGPAGAEPSRYASGSASSTSTATSPSTSSVSTRARRPSRVNRRDTRWPPTRRPCNSTHPTNGGSIGRVTRTRLTKPSTSRPKTVWSMYGIEPAAQAWGWHATG